MAEHIPKRLKKEPLIEAIWQIQFEPAENQPIGDILPGMLFSALRKEQSNWRLQRLAAAEIPPLVAQRDANLRYAAKYRIASDDEPFLYHLGDRVVTLNCRTPYVGWEVFSARINSLIEILEQSGLIPAPQRHSLRYIDLLTLAPPPSISALQVELKIGGQEIDAHPLQLRVTLPGPDCTHVLQVATPARTQLPKGATEGTLIDLESIATMNEMSWTAIRNGLDGLHNASKTLFFRDVLRSDAVTRMQPEY